MLDYEWRCMMAVYIADHVLERFDPKPPKQNPENPDNRPAPLPAPAPTIVRLPKKVT